MPDELCVVDYCGCVGCGQRTTICPSEALRLERRSESEILPAPADQKGWMDQLAEGWGISLSDML